MKTMKKRATFATAAALLTAVTVYSHVVVLTNFAQSNLYLSRSLF
jgi:hypothetical protein